jgi:hypothetical protein
MDNSSKSTHAPYTSTRKPDLYYLLFSVSSLQTPTYQPHEECFEIKTAMHSSTFRPWAEGVYYCGWFCLCNGILKQDSSWC